MGECQCKEILSELGNIILGEDQNKDLISKSKVPATGRTEKFNNNDIIFEDPNEYNYQSQRKDYSTQQKKQKNTNEEDKINKKFVFESNEFASEQKNKGSYYDENNFNMQSNEYKEKQKKEPKNPFESGKNNSNNKNNDEYNFQDEAANDQEVFDDFFKQDKKLSQNQYNNEYNNENNNEEYYNENTQKSAALRTSMSNDEQRQLINEIIEEHNKYRRDHNVPDIKENPEISKMAQAHSEKLAQINGYQNSNNTFNGHKLGENIYFGTEANAEKILNAWCSEISEYDFDNPENFTEKTSHFTQVVWKNTKYIGVGITKTSTGYYFGVVNYYPQGNISGEYEENVLQPSDGPF